MLGLIETSVFEIIVRFLAIFLETGTKPIILHIKVCRIQYFHKTIFRDYSKNKNYEHFRKDKF